MQTTKYLNRKRNSSRRIFSGIVSICFILIFSMITHTCYFNESIKALEVYDEKATTQSKTTSNIESIEQKPKIVQYKKTNLTEIVKTNSLLDIQNSMLYLNKEDSNIPSMVKEDKKIEEGDPSSIIQEENIKNNTDEKEIQNTEFKNDIIVEEPIIESKDSEYTIIKTYDVPAGHSFKSYTSYTLLSPSSAQGILQQKAYTGETGIRMVDDYYCAALGTYYDGNIGDKFLVTLSSGNQFKMILCDVKADCHTDPNNQYTMANGCMIEFYVDYSTLSGFVKQMGDISYIDGFDGSITNIQKIEG